MEIDCTRRDGERYGWEMIRDNGQLVIVIYAREKEGVQQLTMKDTKLCGRVDDIITSFLNQIRSFSNEFKPFWSHFWLRFTHYWEHAIYEWEVGKKTQRKCISWGSEKLREREKRKKDGDASLPRQSVSLTLSPRDERDQGVRECRHTDGWEKTISLTFCIIIHSSLLECTLVDGWTWLLN